jgi:uncharacterized protein YndB with AHSA1/START domain
VGEGQEKGLPALSLRTRVGVRVAAGGPVWPPRPGAKEAIVMAHLVADSSVDISRPPEQVFAFITNPANLTKWVTGVQEASGGPLSAGSRYAMKYKYGGRVNDITMEVTEHEPPRRFGFKTVEGPYPIIGRYRLEPQGQGTRMAYHQDAISDGIVTGIMFGLLGFLLRGQMRKSMARDQQKLKAAIEA